MELTELRREIDAIDDQLVSLFCQRMEIASRIAEYKKANDLPILVPSREQEKLEAVAGKAGPEMDPYIRSLYVEIMKLSRLYQARQNTDPEVK